MIESFAMGALAALTVRTASTRFLKFPFATSIKIIKKGPLRIVP